MRNGVQQSMMGVRVLGALMFAAILPACTSESPAPGARASALNSCSCSGTGIDGPATVSCGQQLCGEDGLEYNCTASGFVQTSTTCVSSLDAGGADGGSCSCSGTGIDGPSTVSCGQQLCGEDGLEYNCTTSGFQQTSTTCHSANADLSMPPATDMAVACTCSGTGINGPTTVSCGQQVCGDDELEYNCTASGFVQTSTTCTASTDGGSGGDGGCTCSGTGIAGPQTVSCGQQLCGEDGLEYNCTAGGFHQTSTSCSSTCSGTGIDGPETVSCGQFICGTDELQYNCTASGLQKTSTFCLGTDCSCTGTAIDGPMTVNCGQSVCGEDQLRYNCTQSGFVQTSTSCTVSCQPCTGTGINGMQTVACGQQICGLDHYEYQCTTLGLQQTGTTC